MRIEDVRGFNYSGSWGTSGLDLWLHHDSELMRNEVARGKKYFPGWNVARWWLSHEAFQREPARFLRNLEDGLAVFESHGIAVMPVLFNRWHDPVCDFGGVPIDHIAPWMSVHGHPDDFSDISRRGDPTSIDTLFRTYLEDVVSAHTDDPRIFAWDLCNEPLMGEYVYDPQDRVRAAEIRWLGWCRNVVRAKGTTAPLTVGNFFSVAAVRATLPFSDFISFHPYFVGADKPGGPVRPDPRGSSPLAFEAALDEMRELADAAGKSLLASETVWGAMDDAERAKLIAYTLGALRDREIGFIAHGLHHSLVADLHAPEFGPVGPPSRMEFIAADGMMRLGHEIFNDF